MVGTAWESRDKIHSARKALRRAQSQVMHQLTVYQFAPVATNSDQNVPAENLGGTTIEPPESSGARNPHNKPWRTWK